jgi:hypothetical protein
VKAATLGFVAGFAAPVAVFGLLSGVRVRLALAVLRGEPVGFRLTFDRERGIVFPNRTKGHLVEMRLVGVGLGVNVHHSAGTAVPEGNHGATCELDRHRDADD